MYIYLSENIILIMVFILGMITGAILYRIITAPLNNRDRVWLAETSELLSEFNKRYPPKIQAPPKPLHNPHK